MLLAHFTPFGRDNQTARNVTVHLHPRRPFGWPLRLNQVRSPNHGGDLDLCTYLQDVVAYFLLCSTHINRCSVYGNTSVSFLIYLLTLDPLNHCSSVSQLDRCTLSITCTLRSNIVFIYFAICET